MTNRQKAERHNYLLNHLKKLVEIDETKLSKDEQEKLLIEKTNTSTEIDNIRKELGINTSTVITEEEINSIE